MSGWFRRPAVVASLVAVVVALAGGLASPIGPWYENLAKPDWTPPNWVFGPVWTLIYALCVVAAVRGWRASETFRDKSWLLSLFFTNAVLNVLWSVLFFTFRRPDWALAEVVPLWLSVLVLVIFFAKRERVAAMLLLPYLAWVGFAAFLNLAIVRLGAAAA